MKMKIMVCGSIGFGGIEKIRKLYDLLQNQGFEIINHIEAKNMDYSDVQDFRDEPLLSKEIVEHDLSYIDKVDVLVVLVGTPSFGTAIEAFVAKDKGKKVILFAPDPLPTPWPLYFSDHHVKSEKELSIILQKMKE